MANAFTKLANKITMSVQEMFNQSYDSDFNQNTTEMLGYNTSSNSLERVTTTNGSVGTDDPLTRKLLQILAPLAVQDTNNRQRVTVDAITNSVATGSSISGVDVIVTAGAPPAVGTQTYQAVWLGPVDQRYVLADQARNTYANAIRPNLTFS